MLPQVLNPMMQCSGFCSHLYTLSAQVAKPELLLISCKAGKSTVCCTSFTDMLKALDVRVLLSLGEDLQQSLRRACHAVDRPKV